MNQIELTEDSRGNRLVRVQLAKAQAPAVLYLTDYERVLATIGNATWFLHFNGGARRYVRAKHPPSARNVMVARLVLGIEFGAIRYRDGDGLNLRHDNLVRPLRRPL